MPSVTYEEAGFVNKAINTNDNFVPFIVGIAYGDTGGDAPTTLQKVTSFSNYKDTFGWSEDDGSTPGSDYTLEQAAWVIFAKYGQGPVFMVNVYNTSDHGGGVGDVEASDITTALDLRENCIVEYGIAPAMILAPGWTDDSTVRTAIQSDTSCYDGTFDVMALIEGDDTEDDHSAIETTAGAIETANCVFSWPDHYQISSSLWVCGAAMKAANDPAMGNGVPFYSFANMSTGQAYHDDDTRVNVEDAGTLNDNGVVTFLRPPGVSVPRIWNHRLLHYNAGDDDYLEDTYIPRMMQNYVKRAIFNTLNNSLSYPINNALIKARLQQLNAVLDNLKARGAVIGARVEFLESDNTSADLQDGNITFRVTWLPAKDAENITVTFSIDFNYLDNLFS